MRPIYSVVFAQLTFGGAGPVTVFEVPEGMTYVLRDVDGQGPTDSAPVILSELSSDQQFAVIPGIEEPSGTFLVYTWRGRQVFEAGETLQIACVYDLRFARLSGYALTNP